MHVTNDLHAVAGSMHRMQVARTDATRRFNFPSAIVNRIVPQRVQFTSFNYRSSSCVAFFFLLLQNFARGRTSETPIYPSSMENMLDVTKRRMVSTWMPCAILGLFIQNESCPIKRDASYALHLFIMRHVSSIFCFWLKTRNVSSFWWGHLLSMTSWV